MKNLGTLVSVAGVLAAVFFSGCGDVTGERLVFDAGGGVGNLPGVGYPSGPGVGDDCSDVDCRSGLVCSADEVCEPGGGLEADSPCTIGPECEDGLQCQFVPDLGISGCLPTEDGEAGETCQTDLDCQSGLRCGLKGFEAVCQSAGEGDVGDFCALQTDCYQGLYCQFGNGTVGTCGYPVPPVGVPLFEGVSCPEQDDENVEALFMVPGAEGTPDDTTFFDHPYPSDIRLDGSGRPDLDGFPTPGPGLLGVDIVARYVEAVEEGTNGWSTNSTIYFRFSGAIDLDSLDTEAGEPRRVFISDVDDLPADPNDGFRTFSTHYQIGSGSNYICDDWFALSTPRDTLHPGHRYVAWITTDARMRETNEPVGRSEQFAAMLEDAPPSGDAALADAYDAFEPLREYLDFYAGSDNEIDPDSILIATVFTTDDPIEPMRQLAQQVEDEPTPSATNWVKCDGDNESPCPQADEAENRACGSGTSDYDEYQALIELPIFQEGDAPYLLEGGNISGSRVRTEQVCMSMSIPTAGSGPYPLVIYGHGTGGSYRGPIRDSVAGALGTSASSFATLGYDAVQHGPRRGDGEGSDEDPENLFFNFVNPDAARGNPLQGAADVLSVIAFATQGDLATAAQTGDAAISVDPARIYYFGHSQGSTHGSIGLPFSDVPATVLSGNGGGLALALMNKTSPVDIAGAIPFIVQDAVQDDDDIWQLRMGAKHPVLSLLQHYIDPADPVNFAPLFTARPEAGNAPKDIFQTFGLDDTYSPPQTLAYFVHAAGLTLAPMPSGVNPGGDNALGLTPASGPVSDNFTLDADTEPVTAVVRQYEPSGGSDGHFVVHDVDEANADAVGFFESLASGSSPTVPVE